MLTLATVVCKTSDSHFNQLIFSLQFMHLLLSPAVNGELVRPINMDINGMQSIIMIIGVEITIFVIKRKPLTESLRACERKSHQHRGT